MSDWAGHVPSSEAMWALSWAEIAEVGAKWVRVATVEPMLRIETVHLDDVVSICKIRKLLQ